MATHKPQHYTTGPVYTEESSQESLVNSTTSPSGPARNMSGFPGVNQSWMSVASEMSDYHRPLDCPSDSSMHLNVDGAAMQGTSALRSVTVSRLMGPSDANVYGNVHGGVILKMIDEAGTIMASRYCNNAANKVGTEAAVGALARIEHMDFLQPMHIQEVAELSAEIVYTHTHCLLVLVKVWAENVITGDKRLTNKARLWYIPLDLNTANTILMVPLMNYLSKKSEDWGYEQYRRQKCDRRAKLAQELSTPIHVMRAASDAEPLTVSASQTCLSVVVGPNDVTFTGYCQGGVLLKLMDECAGTTCCKHCRSICVTACIEATNFHKKIPKGSLIYVHSWLTFTSKRSMEVEVAVEFETRWADPKGSKRQKAVDAFFTFVALDEETGHAKIVPQLKLVTEDEKTRFTQGEQRYHDMKKQRLLDHRHSCEVALLEEQYSASLLMTSGGAPPANAVPPVVGTPRASYNNPGIDGLESPTSPLSPASGITTTNIQDSTIPLTTRKDSQADEKDGDSGQKTPRRIVSGSLFAQIKKETPALADNPKVDTSHSKRHPDRMQVKVKDSASKDSVRTTVGGTSKDSKDKKTPSKDNDIGKDKERSPPPPTKDKPTTKDKSQPPPTTKDRPLPPSKAWPDTERPASPIPLVPSSSPKTPSHSQQGSPKAK